MFNLNIMDLWKKYLIEWDRWETYLWKRTCRGGKIFIFITSLWFITLTYKAVQLNNLDFIIISFHWRPININSKRSHLSWSVIKTRGWAAHAPLETSWDKSPSPGSAQPQHWRPGRVLRGRSLLRPPSFISTSKDPPPALASPPSLLVLLETIF